MPIDESAARKVKDFIESYCCQKNGKPIRILDWQWERVILPLYGTLTPEGKRQYRQLFCFLPRRNGKSTLFACLLIRELVCGEPSGELYVLSNSVTQSADAVYGAALTIVQHSPALQRRLKILKAQNRIINRENNSRLAVLTTTTETLVGKDASVIAFDEIAFFKNRKVYSNLRGSQLNREEPLCLSITTASDNLTGIGRELYDYAVAVRDGKIQDDSFLPVLFEASPRDDWQSPDTWRKCNPSLGQLFKEADLAKLCAEARNEPRKESEFKQFHLNIWQHSAVCWLTREVWDKGGEPFDPGLLEGRSCYTGIDLSRRHDWAAVVHAFPLDGVYYLLPRFFLPGQLVARKEQSDRVPISLWARQGLVTLTEGNVVAFEEIRQAVNADGKLYRIESLAYDPAYAEQLCNQQLRLEDGFDAVEMRQGMMTMAPATATFDRLLRDGKIRHNNNPVLSWMANQTTLRVDSNGNYMPSKKEDQSRNDGIVASIMAVSRAVAAEDCLPAFTVF